MYCNIKRISFLRHAHSDPAGGDENRVLSSKGIAQALEIKKRILFDYDLIISSSAKRSIETAEIISMASVKKIPLEVLKSLYLPSKDDDINDISKMINARPYATPREMLSLDRKGAWQRYTDEAYNDLLKYAEKHKANKLLVIGHSTITNLLGIKFLKEEDGLLDLYVAPSLGFSIISV